MAESLEPRQRRVARQDWNGAKARRRCAHGRSARADVDPRRRKSHGQSEDDGHGDEGQGNGAIPRLAHQQRAYLLPQLAVLRQSPDDRPLGTLMNSVAHQLSDEDMRALADYIATM